MPNTTIQLKKSSTPSAKPADLANGELAINFADGKLFYKNTANYIAEFSSGVNSFGTVNANSTLIVSDTSGDILTIVPGNNITIVGDAINDKVTIGLADSVGIGTNSPTSPLHVSSATFPVARIERSTALTSGSRSSFASVHKTTGDMTDTFGTDVSFIIRDSAEVDNEIATFGAYRDGADNSGTLIFSTYNAGTFGVKMYIKPDGKVGIGNEVPTAKLTVANGTSATSTHIYGTYTNASNYERFAITANSTGNFLSSEAAGTGTARDIKIAAGSSSVILTTSGFANFGGTKVYGSNWGAGYHDSALTAGIFEIANGVDTVWVKLTADAANNMAQRNGTNPQTHRIYGTYTDASNYERLSISASTTADIIRTESAGTGASRALLFGVGGGSQWGLNTSGHLITYGSDNVYDIGTSAGSRPRDVYIAGGLYATTKSFVIDHQSKPNHKLRHGSLEGPENGVYVRGRTDANVIELPEYWTWLVDDESITVTLTSIGKYQKLIVEKIEDNKVYIKNASTGKAKIDCFYMINAERKDVDKLIVEY